VAILSRMPVYEFTCNACGAPVSVFVRSINSPVNGSCSRCGSSDLRRLISRFAVLRSGGDGLDSFSEDEMMRGFDENDPAAMASWARRMKGQVGEDMGPEFDDMVDRIERGELGSADDLGGGEDFGGGFDDF
jgi:putative FmdB family regulatory protein